MKPEVKRYTTMVGSREIAVETGKLAAQAGGAVTVHLNDSIVFAAATMGGIREGIDFFPLSVDYEERMYAGGKIPGSFFRREGRPTTDAILVARLTDRPLRPLFPEGMRNEVQVIMYSLSADAENPLDILAINAASAAIMISDIPWNGPVAAVRIGRVDGQFVANPTFAEIDQSDLDLRIAGTRDAILMVEAGADEIPEDVMVAALEYGHKVIQPLIDLQLKMQAEVGKPKRVITYALPDQALQEKVFARVSGPMNNLLDQPLMKAEFYAGMDVLLQNLVAELIPSSSAKMTVADEGDVEEIPEFALPGIPSLANVKEAFAEAEKKVVRSRILDLGKRPDGRTPTEIRPIWCEVGFSPRAHGSGLFTRGETQVLTLATLGTLRESQEIDSLSPVDSKRYMHHYNFPPFSTGETKMVRGRAGARLGMVPWPNAPSYRSSRPKSPSPTLCGWCPKCWHPTVPPRWLPFAVRPSR